MSKLVQEIRHFVLRPDAAEASHDEIAAEGVRLAQGGHLVKMSLPNGDVGITPEHTHEEVTAMVADNMPKAKPVRGKKAEDPPPPEAA
jgi:hypothetical protein